MRQVDESMEIDSSGSLNDPGNSSTMDDSFHDAFEEVFTDTSEEAELDCYPYTFTPLLLFAPSDYFDKGHSNFNSVASFFAPITDSQGVDMLENVLFDRKNMLYEDLIDHVIQKEMIVTCCIDAHFTALKVMNIGSKPSGVYYDPLKSTLSRYIGDSLQTLLAFLLLKCNYGDSQHIQDNTDHYTSHLSSGLRKTIYRLWKKINLTPNVGYLGLQSVKAFLNIGRYVLVNDSRNPHLMSVQLTSNSCYFQTYLFAVLCKVGEVITSRDGRSVDVPGISKLEAVTANMARHLLEFFTEMNSEGGTILRPLTNCNFVLDFYRFQSAPYHTIVTSYLQSIGRRVPDYERQYHEITRYFWKTKLLHKYDKLSQSGAMAATPNTKSLQAVSGADGALNKLCRSDYYKYRAANFMFGWNSVILQSIESFCEFNSLRKNQLLHFSEVLAPYLREVVNSFFTSQKTTKYREYYFMGQYEIGQSELVDVHHYTYMLDFVSLSGKEPEWLKTVQKINEFLAEQIYWSTQKRHNYEKILSSDTFRKSKKSYKIYLETFMSPNFFRDYIGLGFSDINPKEKDINCLTQTVFYTTDLMRQQAHRQEFEFEKECVNQMARSSIRRYMMKFVDVGLTQGTRVNIKIGMGYCYSKYNTLMHLLSVVYSYWRNPDLSNIQCLGKDIRALFAVSCQKIFFHKGHSGYYHYGPLEDASGYRGDSDLAVASSSGLAVPIVSRTSRAGLNELVLTDRVFEYQYLKKILHGIFEKAGTESFKSDNEVLNLCLLSLLLDFGLYEKYAGLINLSFLQELQHQGDTRELQVEIANRIYDFDRKNTSDAITRSHVQELLYEMSYKFLVNKDFPIQSNQFKLIRELNSDPAYQSYVLLVKVYMSLCQINRSTEVDYYKVLCNGEYKIVIPKSYSKVTADYLEDVTKRYTFSMRDGMMLYDDLPVFDLRPKQPDINLYKVRLDSASNVHSMVKYLEISNVLHMGNSEANFEKYLIFIADNVLMVEVAGIETRIKINKNDIEVATIFFNDAISFIPAFKYKDSEDVVLFTSPNIRYLVDGGGQFSSEYYGMRHELIEHIKSEEVFVDLNDEHVFKSFKLSDLVTESKTVVYFPDYVLQVPSRQQLINLLDLAIKIRNVSFFILVLFYLRRASIQLTYQEVENDSTRITGPWREAILYVLNRAPGNAHYDTIFSKQFFDLNQNHIRDLPLDEFIDVLCVNFTRYQRYIDGQYQIVPTEKQKSFLAKIIRSEEPCHFSEVGTGKTKVIMPLLCQAFLSNNADVHRFLSRRGKKKHVLVILVPEHLVSDARAQIYRYCLNCLHYREEFRIHDDIFALMSKHVQIGGSEADPKPMKRIFVSSFNSFKKVLTNDSVCRKVQPFRENFILVVDECDDFLDRNKLVFNICSNRNNAFTKPTLDLFYETSRVAYHHSYFPENLIESSDNPDYWNHLRQKFSAIHEEIQDASRSINKSFGIFNEYTLRHCTSNILHDIEGYKSLIARPYESVNRAMPGSYYSDVERTIFLTYVLLREDVTKFDELFQAERKFISFEYWNQHFVHHLDFDDLVYGHAKLSEIVTSHPETKDGLDRYLYEIILRRLEIRDQSRSVSSIDLVFNFDMIGFTGTPFLDNYPTFEYIRQGRTDEIPHMIDRSFYVYSSENLAEDEFQRRFTQFQGKNSHTTCEYVNSNFIRNATSEMSILESLFEREADEMRCNSNVAKFNAVVDLCGVFKRSNIHDVRNLLVKHFGQERFHYIYHIASNDNSDRVLSVASETDMGYDEEFYSHMCKLYADGKALRDKIFFFVDNRNVVGKDIPFQLIFQKHFGEPLIQRSLVIAHDVDDFSKIWQAMGRSRTMNETIFTIYKSGVTDASSRGGPENIKLHPLTRELYVRNCDSKMAGNISSIYLTLIALLNFAQKSFYYCDTIVNVFLEKMEKTITANVSKHEEQLVRLVLGNTLTAQMLNHILKDKFRLSADAMVANTELSLGNLEGIMRHIVRQKFEQRQMHGNIFDNMIVFLSGEQKSLMEISYTKQQQKQKQKQQNKNQDSDAMGVFDDKNQLMLSYRADDYFLDTLNPLEDSGKKIFNLPVSVPILALSYVVAGKVHHVKVYPTVQFLYSHHIYGKYVTKEVQDIVKRWKDASSYYANFFHAVEGARSHDEEIFVVDSVDSLSVVVTSNLIRPSPLYSMAAVKPGVYVIGMKDQFNRFDVLTNPLCDAVQYVTDEMGLVLFDRTKSKRLDVFGPYFIETYILMEVLSKHEVAQNVMSYFCKNRDLLQRALDGYDEQQGKGFICWRFLMNETAKTAALANGSI